MMISLSIDKSSTPRKLLWGNVASRCNPPRTPDAWRHCQLPRHVHANFVQAGYAGKWTPIFFPFLHIAFTVRGPDDQRVITWSIWHPFGFPKRPCQIAAGIMDLSVAPRFAAVAAKFHARDTAVATVGDPLHFNRPVQFA